MKLFKMAISAHIMVFLGLSLLIPNISSGQEMKFIPFQASLLSLNAIQGPVDVTVRVYDALEGGNEMWSESHENVEVSGSVISLLIGKGTSNTTISSGLFGTNDARYVELEIGDDVLDPRYPLGSVPRAFIADEALGVNAENGIRANAIVIGRDGNVDYEFEYETIGTTEDNFNLRLQSNSWIQMHTVGERRLVIDTAGRVGIGNVNPESVLHVGGDMTLDLGEGLQFVGDGGYFGGSSDARIMRIIDRNKTGGGFDGGFVIAGYTPDDNASLELLTIRENLFEFKRDVRIDGDISANNLSSSSDSRLKANINPIKDPLERILVLNGVSHQWRYEEFPERNFDRKTHFGFIAQDVNGIVPEVIGKDSKDFLTVDYSKMVPLLVEAIKEQNELITDMGKEVEMLKEAIRILSRKDNDIIESTP